MLSLLSLLAVVWPLETLFTTPKTYDASVYATNGVQVTFYDGLPYKGKATRIFAYYGVPNHAPGTKVPAMVLIHGGAGSAFYRWVRFWNDRGYAAISMDTCGKVSGNTIGQEQVGHYPHAWSGPAGWGGFEAMADADEDHWMFHAAAAVIRGHSFLRSLPDVDADRIGVTGVSWGGILTCVVASLDSRFKFAAPVYGCGDIFGTGWFWQGTAARIGEKNVALWRTKWDPISYLPKASVPFHWLDGTNDKFFALPAIEHCRNVLSGVEGATYRVRLHHAHSPVSENAPELLALADHYLKGGPDIPRFGSVTVTNGMVRATVAFEKALKPVRAVLDYTKDDPDAQGIWYSRYWQSVEATLDGNSVSVSLPEGAKAFYLSVETSSGVRSSSHIVGR